MKTNLSKLQTILREKGLYPDISELVDNTIVVTIDWGDWKHEHGYLKHVMSEIGFRHISTDVIESDGSDCYSAEHRFENISFA